MGSKLTPAGPAPQLMRGQGPSCFTPLTPSIAAQPSFTCADRLGLGMRLKDRIRLLKSVDEIVKSCAVRASHELTTWRRAVDNGPPTGSFASQIPPASSSRRGRVFRARLPLRRWRLETTWSILND